MSVLTQGGERLYSLDSPVQSMVFVCMCVSVCVCAPPKHLSLQVPRYTWACLKVTMFPCSQVCFRDPDEWEETLCLSINHKTIPLFFSLSLFLATLFLSLSLSIHSLSLSL